MSEEKIKFGAVDDGAITRHINVPSTKGNDPNKVCLDIRDSRLDRRWGSLPSTTIPTKQFLGSMLRTRAEGEPKNVWAAPPSKEPRIEFCSTPDMVEFHSGRSGHSTSLFFETLHLCFSAHLPFGISPEVLMYLVLHEISVTVKRNPDKYAHLFTKRTDGQKTLVHVEHDGLILGQPSPWGEVLGLFRTDMTERIPSEVLGHALPAFSTHTEISQAASMVAFMDAASPYYVFLGSTLCGIPQIRLYGEPEDYQKLVRACSALSEFFTEDLGSYFETLLPTLRTIAEQAAGAPIDQNFWTSIYKHHGGSGTDDMTGWASDFIHHLVDPRHPDQVFTKDVVLKKRVSLPRKMIPLHLSRTDFIWDYYGNAMPMEFVGGVMGLENQDGILTPRLGFAVLHAST